MTTRALLLLALLAGCATESDHVQQAEDFLRVADYYQAYQEMQEARRLKPGDDQIEKRYWEVRKLFLLDQARALVFRGREEEALGVLEQVRALDPDNEIAAAWEQKARGKLAERAAYRGNEAVSAGDLEQALLAYNEALRHVPRYPDAVEGLQKVERSWRDRRTKAQDRYLEGVRALAEQLFAQTEYHMYIALENDPSLARAEERRDLARRRLAEERITRAEEYEKERFFGAALKEYELAFAVLTEREDLKGKIAQMRNEVEVEHIVQRGELAVLRGDHAEGRRLLLEALERSETGKARISDLLVLAREREFADRYLRAKDLELEREYKTALEQYRQIDAEWAGYQDVRTRISGLETALQLADESIAKGKAAEEAGDPKAALQHYRDAALYAPGYADVAAKIRDLTAKIDSGGQ